MLNAEGLKILLVDDMQLVLNRLKIMLSAIKHVSKTETADTAEKALLMIKDFQPHMLLLDINMPRMNGIEILKYVRNKHCPHTVVIMLTNHSFSVYKEECLRLGANYFLDKSRDFLLLPTIIKTEQENRLRRSTEQTIA
jgi:DNA-binding NarL/FixJ family response regulator